MYTGAAAAAALISAKDVVTIVVEARRSYAALYSAITRLSEDQTLDLIALSLIGRGEYHPSRFLEARTLANTRYRGNASDRVLGTPGLGDLLEEGLSALMFHASDPARRRKESGAEKARPESPRTVPALAA